MKKSIVRFLILLYSFLLFSFIFIGTQTGNSKLFPLNFKNRNSIIKTERSIEDVIENIKSFQKNYEDVNPDVENRKKRFTSDTQNFNIIKLNFVDGYTNVDIDKYFLKPYDSVFLSISEFNWLLSPPFLGDNENCSNLKITAFDESTKFDYNASFIKQLTYGKANPEIVYGTKDALFYNILGFRASSNELNLNHHYHVATDEVQKKIKKSILDLEKSYVKKQNPEILNGVINNNQNYNFSIVQLSNPKNFKINLKDVENIKNYTICKIPDNENDKIMILYNLICIHELKKNFDTINEEFDLLNNLNNPTDFRLGVLSFFLKDDMVNNLDNSVIFKEFKELYQDKFLDLCFKKQDKLSNDGKYIYDYPLIICIDIIKKNMVETINNIKVGGILNNPLDLNFNWGELNSNTTTINPIEIAKKRRLLYDENHDTKSNSETYKYTKKEIFDIFFNDYTNVIVAKSIIKNFEEPIEENSKGNCRYKKFLCREPLDIGVIFCDLRSNANISISDNEIKDILLSSKINVLKDLNSSKILNFNTSNDNPDLKDDLAKLLNSLFFTDYKIIANISSDTGIDKLSDKLPIHKILESPYFTYNHFFTNSSFRAAIDKKQEEPELNNNKDKKEKVSNGTLEDQHKFEGSNLKIEANDKTDINQTQTNKEDDEISKSNMVMPKMTIIILPVLLSKLI